MRYKNRFSLPDRWMASFQDNSFILLVTAVKHISSIAALPEI